MEEDQSSLTERWSADNKHIPFEFFFAVFPPQKCLKLGWKSRNFKWWLDKNIFACEVSKKNIPVSTVYLML